MTPGQVALRRIPDAAIARATGAKASTIRGWRVGARPREEHRIALALAFGIPLDSWGHAAIDRMLSDSTRFPFQLKLERRGDDHAGTASETKRIKAG